MQAQIRMENIYAFTEPVVTKEFLYAMCWQYCGE